MTGPFYPSVLDVLGLHRFIMERMGQTPALRDEGALSSALMRPAMAARYEDADLATQAVRLITGIVLAHPFVDGNKRVAFVAMMLFLRKNGIRFSPPPADATAIMLALAAGQVNEAGLTRWIKDNWP